MEIVIIVINGKSDLNENYYPSSSCWVNSKVIFIKRLFCRLEGNLVLIEKPSRERTRWAYSKLMTDEEKNDASRKST